MRVLADSAESFVRMEIEIGHRKRITAERENFSSR